MAPLVRCLEPLISLPMTLATLHDFTGAKLILFIGSELLVIRRDDIPDIPWPGHLDFPGGGRECDEDPASCVLRETREEVALELSADDLGWSRSRQGANGLSWFFAAHLPRARARAVRLGDEGTSWHLMSPNEFLSRSDAIPHFAEMLSIYLSEKSRDGRS